MPEVSVIIPNYNHAEYLSQRIDSVLNQTYKDFELIILDDFSSDDSLNVIKRYAGNIKISHVVCNKENSGNPFKQWDKGINLAKGKYIWIAESDDWCEYNLLENIITGIEQHKDCVIGYCQSYCISGNNRIKFQSAHTSLTEYVDGKKFIYEYLLPRNPIFNAGMAVWKKEVYTKISKEYINYKLIGDYYFWIEVAGCGDVFICGKLLNYFRIHDMNVSIDAFNKGFSYTEQLPIFKQLLERQIIDKKDYLGALKKAYFFFRMSGKTISRQNSISIEKLFSSYAKTKYKLKLYFFQKYIQDMLRKKLRL